MDKYPFYAGVSPSFNQDNLIKSKYDLTKSYADIYKNKKY